ncbi:MAG TPA: hypothetical protein PKG48_03135 [Bacteroidales bacterium]|nr:hypothetical protein [Bacteroidales bacterium]HPS63012.1 hypothetical protein [Bacteroidales bacterium]
MKIIRRIGALAMILVLLYGTAGMTVFHHICNGKHTDEVTLYSGILTGPESSCCGDEMRVAPVACSMNSKADGASRIEEPACCKSLLAFYKLDVTQTRVMEPLHTTLAVADIPAAIECAISAAHPPQDVTTSFYRFESPPLSGRSLVIFLHQVRIPAPSSLS